MIAISLNIFRNIDLTNFEIISRDFPYIIGNHMKQISKKLKRISVLKSDVLKYLIDDKVDIHQLYFSYSFRRWI